MEKKEILNRAGRLFTRALRPVTEGTVAKREIDQKSLPKETEFKYKPEKSSTLSKSLFWYLGIGEDR